MTMNTSGFYKNEDGQLLYGPTTVQFPISVDHPGLNRAQQDSYTYPVEGWYWFDTENEARGFFGLELVEEEPEPLMVRARDESGRFIADDPSTPEDEAWVPAP